MMMQDNIPSRYYIMFSNGSLLQSSAIGLPAASYLYMEYALFKLESSKNKILNYTTSGFEWINFN